MEVVRNPMDDVYVFRSPVREDERGRFLESFTEKGMGLAGIDKTWVQDNCSRSKQGVLRGLHFQSGPSAQAKFVRCLNGVIYDVVVDCRPRSKTFGEYFGVLLDDEKGEALYVGEGFAHGFLVLSKEADVLYKVSSYYDPKAEGGLNWSDPRVSINWPSMWKQWISDDFSPIVHPRDAAWPRLDELTHEL